MWKLGLLSMVGKVLGRSIINMMRDEVDRRLRKEVSGQTEVLGCRSSFSET